MAAVGPARSLYEHTEVQRKEGGSAEELGGLSQATFACQKWDNAIAYLRSSGLATEDSVREILLEGARSFGCWRLSDAALDALVRQVLEDGGGGALSHGMESWVQQSRAAVKSRAPLARKKTLDVHMADMPSVDGQKLEEGRQPEEDPRFRSLAGTEWRGKSADVMEDWVGVVDAITLRRFKWGLALLLTAVSSAYASWVVFVQHVGILELFAWPIIFARAGGMGAAMITGLMYLTMARTFMKQFYKFLGANSKLLMVFDGHKDVHLFLARCLVVTAAVHVLAHLLSTVPALGYGTAEELNAVLACAHRDVKLRDMPSFAWLRPACPLEEQESMGWSVLFQSTPGVSGLVLVLLLGLLGYTGRARARRANFDRFWYAHNFVLVAWPLTMFIHGSNQWMGVGFPLVAFTATLPIGLYLMDRIGRLLRFYVFGGRAVQIDDAVIRPGKGGGTNGALTHLAITKPTGLWDFAPGMYAFVCMPEYAPMQWHPFTICSGKSDEHVEFIISGVGDWTQELAARCFQAQDGHIPLPRIALDGPYPAPAQSALSCPILVAVGAGVGIAPFLSLMSSLISLIEDSSEAESQALPLKEAHFFWMTRSMDEFLFGRKHFTRIAQSHRLRQKLHLHLHTTAREPEGDGAAYLFRQAVKRQSKVDKVAFKGEFDAQHVLTAPQLPWCWVNRSELDVMWLSDLTTANQCPSEAYAATEADVQTQHAAHAKQPVAEEHEERTALVPTFPASPSQHALARQLSPSTSASGCSRDWAEGLLRSKGRLASLGHSLRASSSDDLLGSPTAMEEGCCGGRAVEEDSDSIQDPAPLVPIAFGRPDFETELRAIGKYWGCQEKVHIYVCGNGAIVKGLRGTADTLNAEARSNAKNACPSAQKFVVAYERFG